MLTQMRHMGLESWQMSLLFIRELRKGGAARGGQETDKTEYKNGQTVGSGRVVSISLALSYTSWQKIHV
ncbi:unnamed protein product [Lathyrus sativus]|nr:unnamed protein product [Lathyrus sativus]